MIFLNKRKYSFVNVIKYMRFSDREKLKYHKYKNHKAEKKKYIKYVCKAITIKHKQLSNNGNKDNRFSLTEIDKKILDKHKGNYLFHFKTITTKLNNGNTLELTIPACKMIKTVMIKVSERKPLPLVASIIDDSSVIKWDDTFYRKEILEILENLVQGAVKT